MDLSVIIPIKDEKDNLGPLRERLHQAIAPLGLKYEFVIVDDGSTDGSGAVLEAMAAVDPCLKVVRLRRNYGQTAALQAGIDWSSGDVLVTMDGDLQNDPADIPILLAKLNEGYDAVLGERAKRQDDFLVRKLPSRMANWLIRKVTNTSIRDLGCTLRVMRRDLAEAIPLYGEMHRFIAVLLQQHGGKLIQIPVKHHPRVAGKTKYNLSRTIRVVLDLITVTFLHSYLTRPMHMMGTVGLGAMALGLLSLIATVAMKLTGQSDMTGNPFLYFSVMLEVVGVQFLSMGLLGELMTRTYFESQGKASYVVRDTLNLQAPVQRKAA